MPGLTAGLTMSVCIGSDKRQLQSIKTDVEKLLSDVPDMDIMNKSIRLPEILLPVRSLRHKIHGAICQSQSSGLLLVALKIQ